MATYRNGYIPAGVLKTYARGTDANGYYEFQSTEATWARWQMVKRYCETHFGRTVYIRTGWNIYRPYDIQVAARDRACALGNCAGAALEGTSSHGGNWYYNNALRDCLAIDVDPNGLTWSQVWEAARAAGFAVGLITSKISAFPDGEPWHIIDFNAFGPVPAGADVTEFPIDSTTGDDDMYIIRAPGPNRPNLLISGDGGVYALNAEESTNFGSIVSKDTMLNDRQYDLIVSAMGRITHQGSNAGLVEQLWARAVDRGTAGKVPAIQELADAKTNTIALLNRPAATITDAQIKAIADAVIAQISIPDVDVQIDYDRIATDVRAAFTEHPLTGSMG